MKAFPLMALILCISIPAALHSMMSYHLLETDAQKKVLILGDQHSVEDPEIEKLLPTFVTRIMKHTLKRPVPFIVEGKDDEKDMSFVAESLTQLKNIDAAQKKLDFSPLSFRYFDARGAESSALAGLHTKMGEYVVRKLPASHLLKRYLKEAFSGELEPYDDSDWKIVTAAIEKNDLTHHGALMTKSFLAYLEQSRLKLLALVAKYAHKDNVHAMLQKLLAEFTHAQVEFTRLLPEPDMGIAYARNFLNKSLDERLTLYEHLNELIAATDYAFAECTFFDKVVDTLETEPCVCLFVGDSHPRNITQLLLASGCTPILNESLVEFKYPLMESLLAHKSDGLLKSATSLLPIFLEPIIAVPSTCWTCAKKPEKLMACSICRRAIYCSGDCQKADWSSHKKWCKKTSAPQKK